MKKMVMVALMLALFMVSGITLAGDTWMRPVHAAPNTRYQVKSTETSVRDILGRWAALDAKSLDWKMDDKLTLIGGEQLNAELSKASNFYEASQIVFNAVNRLMPIQGMTVQYTAKGAVISQRT